MSASGAAAHDYCPGQDHGHGREVELLLPFDVGESPESVTLDKHDNIYLSMSNEVLKLSPQGSLTTFGTLPIQAFVLGLKVGPDQCVYAASTSLDPSVQGAFVWRFCKAGQPPVKVATLDPMGGPNDLAFDGEGNLFVTDPLLGRIYKIDSYGHVQVWLSDPILQGNPDNPALVLAAFGVDGIAFDSGHQNLYVSNLDYGRIIRIPIGSHGAAQTPHVFAESPLLVGADGIAFDKKGDLYVAVNAQDQLAVVDRHGDVSMVEHSVLFDGPSSVAFGTKGDDKRTLYIVSGAFMRTFGVKSGTPAPALLSSPRDEKGLPLP